MVGLQKSSLLNNSRWVQSPTWPKVQQLLDEIKISDSYHTRGTGEATALNELAIVKHRHWVKDIVDLSDFPYAYVTAGATDAINHWRATDDRPWQFFTGDYQWPNIISQNGKECKYINTKDVLYISNPQCSDGNFRNLPNIENPVILDCAYITATAKQKMFIPKNTEQIMFSFSKGFGLIGQRCGIVYTKEPHKSLHPLSKVECFNYSAAPIMLAMMKNFSVDEMYYLYQDEQDRICDKYDLKPSDTYFIGTSTDPFYKKRRRVGDIARLCLTGIE